MTKHKQNENKKMDLEKMFANFEDLRVRSLDSIRSIFQEMNEETKQQLHQWLADIREIKENQSLSAEQKQTELSQVKTSETILNFIKAFMDVLLHKIPLQNKAMLNAGLTGAGMAAAYFKLNTRATMVAMAVLRKALPKFILSPAFEAFGAFIERELPMTANADVASSGRSKGDKRMTGAGMSASADSDMETEADIEADRDADSEMDEEADIDAEMDIQANANVSKKQKKNKSTGSARVR